MRKVFLLMVFMVFLLSNALMAQFRISGKVITAENEPLEYAEVTLFSATSTPLINNLTDDKGVFSIAYQKGTYRLEIRQFNKVLHTRSIELNSDFDAGNIEVNTAKALDDVVITRKKELVERKIDRLVFNIENTISTAGGDALDALQITPGVLVRNGTINMVGKQSIRVLIDDKIVELVAEDLTNFLRSIPSDNIKSIEVITTPPAKYDAAGGSGLINIKLKKSQRDSWSLSLGSSYMQKSAEDEGAITSNFMYNKNKLSLSSSLNYRDGGETHHYKDYNAFPNEIWHTSQVFTRKYKRLNGIAGLQYQVKPNWVVGFQYIANLNKTASHRPTTSMVYDHSSQTSFNDILSLGNAYQRPRFNSLNLFNEIRLDSSGKKVILNLDYFTYSNQDARPYEGTSVIKNPYTILYFKGVNDNTQRTNNFSGKADFEIPSKIANWSTGAKVSVLNTGNRISAFNSGLVKDPVAETPQTTHTFDYSENIQAMYFSGNRKFSNNLEVQAGLRMEATQTKSYNGNSEQSLTNNYTKLFPTLSISYSATQNSAYAFNYSKRMERPNFAELNPNTTYITPFLTVQGNQLLRPYFVDNFEFIYTYKKLESKLYHSLENDAFNQIGIPDLNTSHINLIYRNIYNIKRYGFSELFIFDKFSWWSSNNMFNINYMTSETIDIPAAGMSGWNSGFTSNNDFTLNKEKTVLFNLNVGYIIIGTYGIEKVRPSSSTAMAIQYLMFNKDLRITLRANDVFKTDKYRFGAILDGVQRNSDYYFDSRFVQLSISYKFGNKKMSIKKRETGNETERRRTGN